MATGLIIGLFGDILSQALAGVKAAEVPSPDPGACFGVEPDPAGGGVVVRDGSQCYSSTVP